MNPGLGGILISLMIVLWYFYREEQLQYDQTVGIMQRDQQAATTELRKVIAEQKVNVGRAQREIARLALKHPEPAPKPKKLPAKRRLPEV